MYKIQVHKPYIRSLSEPRLFLLPQEACIVSNDCPMSTANLHKFAAPKVPLSSSHRNQMGANFLTRIVCAASNLHDDWQDISQMTLGQFTNSKFGESWRVKAIRDWKNIQRFFNVFFINCPWTRVTRATYRVKSTFLLVTSWHRMTTSMWPGHDVQHSCRARPPTKPTLGPEVYHSPSYHGNYIAMTHHGMPTKLSCKGGPQVRTSSSDQSDLEGEVSSARTIGSTAPCGAECAVTNTSSKQKSATYSILSKSTCVICFSLICQAREIDWKGLMPKTDELKLENGWHDK